jgi:hypothetical protein
MGNIGPEMEKLIVDRKHRDALNKLKESEMDKSVVTPEVLNPEPVNDVKEVPMDKPWEISASTLKNSIAWFQNWFSNLPYNNGQALFMALSRREGLKSDINCHLDKVRNSKLLMEPDKKALLRAVGNMSEQAWAYFNDLKARHEEAMAKHDPSILFGVEEGEPEEAQQSLKLGE